MVRTYVLSQPDKPATQLDAISRRLTASGRLRRPRPVALRNVTFTFASSSTRYSPAWGNHRLTGPTGMLRQSFLARDRTHRSRVSLSTYLGTVRTAPPLRLDQRQRSREPNRCARVPHHPETKLRCPKGMSSREDQGILCAPPLTVKSDSDSLDWQTRTKSLRSPEPENNT